MGEMIGVKRVEAALYEFPQNGRDCEGPDIGAEDEGFEEVQLVLVSV